MTTPPLIVIDAQTRREDERRIVYRAHFDAQRRKRIIRVLRVLIAVCVAGAVVAAFALGLYLLGGI